MHFYRKLMLLFKSISHCLIFNTSITQKNATIGKQSSLGNFPFEMELG